MVFPYYLSIGMTYEQFWHDDPYLVVFYRKADKLKIKRKNEELWLQGMYIYDAVSTVIYNSWGRKKSQKAAEYASEPYSLYDDEEEKNVEKDITLEKAKAKVWMESLVSRDRAFLKKGG